MCGIVGYVGAQEAAPILLDGLRRLEYRGYDSAGMAVCGPEGLQVCKTRGRLQALADLTEEGRTLTGTLGVGHTRWATHGEPNDINAHPQVSQRACSPLSTTASSRTTPCSAPSSPPRATPSAPRRTRRW